MALSQFILFFVFTSASFAAPSSNLKIKNSGGSTKVISGLYVRKLSQVAAGHSCSAATVIYPDNGVGAAPNSTVGAMAMRIPIASLNEVDIGAGFLYNMIYNAAYYVQTVYPSSPPGCALPGCTWGADTTLHRWCLEIGILAPVSVGAGLTKTSIVPAWALSSSSGNYEFNLVGTSQTLGPVTCDDQTLTCTAAAAQTQSF